MGGADGLSSRFAEDADQDLLGYIAIDPTGQSAREAGHELYTRHRTRLFNVLKRSWGRTLDDESLADLVHDTFMAAFDSAESYAGTTETACLNWLVGIARNRLRIELERGSSVRAELVLSGQPEASWSVQVPETVSESEAVTLTEQALAGLDEREQEVLRVTMEFSRPGSKHQRLPNAIAAGLAARWSTTTTNIRAIRKRAMDKIKAAVEPHLKKRGQK